MKKKMIIGLIIIILLLIAFGATVTIEWLYDTFGHLSMDEIIFHLKVPMEGTNTDIIFIFIQECLLKVIIPTGIISFILIYPMVRNLKFIDDKIHTAEKRRTVVVSFTIAVLILGVSIKKIIDTTDIKQYIQSQLDDSHFIEKEYIDPKKVNIEFGEEKRNLIYIYLESMESTYYSIKNGGLSQKSLIPEIEKLAKENVNFSSTQKLKGAYTLYGTTWTVGAMTAQTLGLPLKLSIDVNSLGEYSVFLGGAYGLGEILEKNGYHNFLLLGSDVTFGGRKNLFEQHGNYEIWDKLRDVMERLSKIDFVRCHNSYIVYMPAVKEMEKGYFILKNDTKIIISQRLSSIMEADQILMMENGRIVDRGTHEELLSRNEEYRMLYETQEGDKKNA